ncbi:MAG TPA: MFS transporter [Devosiaceae bacterium]
MKTETWAVFGLVGLMLIANGLLGTALPLHMSSLGIPPAYVAALGAFAYGGGLVGAPLSTLAIGRLGNRGAFILFAALFALFVLALLTTSQALALQLLRMGAGVCFSALTVVVDTRINTLAPGDRRSRVLALYMITFYAAQATGASLTGLDRHDGNAALVASALVLLVAVVASLAIKAPGGRSENRSVLPRARHLLMAPGGYLVGLMTGAMVGCFYGFGPVFALGRLANPSLVGTFMAAAMMGAVAGLMLSGRLADRFGLRSVSMPWAILLAVTAVVLTIRPPTSDPGLIGIAAVLGAFLLSFYPIGSAMVNARASVADRVPANALYVVCIGLGGMIGPLVGVLLTPVAGTSAGFAVIAVCSATIVIAAAVWGWSFSTGLTPAKSVDL